MDWGVGFVGRRAVGVLAAVRALVQLNMGTVDAVGTVRVLTPTETST